MHAIPGGKAEEEKGVCQASNQKQHTAIVNIKSLNKITLELKLLWLNELESIFKIK